MAQPKSTDELDELAFRLYSDRIAKLPAQSSGEAAGAWAYRKAEEFLAIRDRIKTGGVAVIQESKLADVCAPNLKPTHPHNLVSQRYAERHGGEQKVLSMLKEIHAWLLANPRSDESPVAYERLDWDVPTTNLARVLIPHYASN